MSAPGDLRGDLEAALARFKLVEPFTVEDAAAIAKHLRFALGDGAEVEVFRNTPTDHVLVAAWRNGATVRLKIKPFASAAEATTKRGT